VYDDEVTDHNRAVAEFYANKRTKS
jgi:hypothetical protein